MINNNTKIWLETQMSLDIDDFQYKLLSLPENDQELIGSFVNFCVENLQQKTINVNVPIDFHSHPQVKIFTNELLVVDPQIIEYESKIVLDSIRQAFSHFAVGGLHQLYERQENELWYPKVVLRNVLEPNDINLLPEVIEIYRGCDISEFHSKNFNQAWTTKEEIAHGFAFTHYASQAWFKSFNRVLLKATIDKKNVFYAKDTGEYEVVVDICSLSNVEVVESSPLVSVVMSVYNEPLSYLVEAIDSMLYQSYKNLEFIIVLDNPGNLDALNLIKQYSASDSRVFLIENKDNIGLALSLNKAINYSRGVYIARMDADDSSKITRIEEQFIFMQNNQKYSLVGTGVEIIDHEGCFVKFQKAPMCYKYFDEIINYKTISFHPTWFMRRIVFDKIGGYHNLQTAQDYDFLYRLIKKGFFVYNLDKFLLSYRISASATSTKRSLIQLKTKIYISRFSKFDFFDYNKYVSFTKVNSIEGFLHSVSSLLLIKAKSYSVYNPVSVLLKVLSLFTSCYKFYEFFYEVKYRLFVYRKKC